MNWVEPDSDPETETYQYPGEAIDVEAVMPGVMLKPEAEQDLADIDKIELLDLLSPSKLTEYLTKTIGEYQAVVDVDALPSIAMKQMMRQALLLVLANQKILGKSHARADELKRLRDDLESYIFADTASVVARLKTMIATVEPAVKNVLKGVLEEADEIIVKLVHKHVDAAADGHELIARRGEVEQLKALLVVAAAARTDAVNQLGNAKIAADEHIADIKKAGAKFAAMACGFGFMFGGAAVAAVVFFAR